MKKIMFFAFLIGSLISCNQETTPKSRVPDNVDKFATEFILDIQRGNIDKCLSQVLPEINTKEGRDYLINTFHTLQPLQLDSFKIVDAGVNTVTKVGEGKKFTNYQIIYQYFLKDRFLYFSFGIREENNGLSIRQFNGRFLDTPLSQVHEFTLTGKTVMHYMFLVCVVLVPLFILLTLIVAIRTKIETKKWLWIIGIIFGFARFSINWTTGAIGFQLIYFQLFGASYFKEGNMGPLTIFFSVPVIAIVFWIKRRDLIGREISASSDKMRGESVGSN